jgi:metal-responsive CopG/Arc/MetJ family transcriptional regulator
MKTVQMTINEELLSEVDEVIQSLRTTRSAFIREVLQLALHHYHIDRLEKQQAEGYARYPSAAGDVDEWAAEQVWVQ